jgi:hypothetical protein
MEASAQYEPIEASRPGQAAHGEAELTVNLQALTNAKRRPKRFGEAQNKPLATRRFFHLASLGGSLYVVIVDGFTKAGGGICSWPRSPHDRTSLYF